MHFPVLVEAQVAFYFIFPASTVFPYFMLQNYSSRQDSEYILTQDVATVYENSSLMQI